ncbi:MAG: four helix bundle protein [Rhodothermales bacterium]
MKSSRSSGHRSDAVIRATAFENRLIVFAIRACDAAEELPSSFAGSHVAGQLIRAGTAAAPHYAEAQSAESRKDFVHKLKIGVKELREAKVWLKFIEQKGFPVSTDLNSLLAEADELISIFVKSIQTAQRNQAGTAHTRTPPPHQSQLLDR